MSIRLIGPPPAPDWRIQLLDSARDLATAQIDLEVLDLPPAHRDLDRFVGHSSVALVYAILRAGIADQAS